MLAHLIIMAGTMAKENARVCKVVDNEHAVVIEGLEDLRH